VKSAVIAAVVAALVSASGTYAASRVLITSTKQIAPPVLTQLAKLKAKTSYVQGPAGPAGSSIVGPEGRQGAPGIGESIAGPPGLQGPEGKSIVGPAGEIGPRGERGESIAGPHGEAGASSMFVVEERATELRELYVGQRLSTAATCPPGSTPVGGGFQSEPEGVGVIIGSFPNEDNGWATTIEVTHPPAWPAEATFDAWADCIR
jgi:hypothetical protein